METWTLTSSDEQALGVFERKFLRKTYGPFCDRGEWSIRWNQELYDIYDDIDISDLTIYFCLIYNEKWYITFVFSELL